MYLYDGTSDVDFFYAGTMTHAEISEDPSLADLISTPCVLYDDGEGGSTASAGSTSWPTGTGSR